MSEYKKYILLVSFLIVLLTLVFVFWPFVVMWALNTLFDLEIQMTWPNWLAVLILLACIRHINFNND